MNFARRFLVRAFLAFGALATIAEAQVDETLAPSLFAARRARLLEGLGPEAVVVVCTAPVTNRNGDVDHLFRPASNFWYLTGFGEPDGAALLETRDGKPHCTLFVPESDPGAELWTGPRLGVAGAKPLADEVIASGRFATEVAARIADRADLFADFGGDERRHRELDAATKTTGGAGHATPPSFEESALKAAIGRLRLVKSGEEIALLRRAIDITCVAEREAMRFAAPGQHEYQLQAVIEGTYLLLGSPRVGFPSIVGSGRNSCILHYETNRAVIPPDRTIVLDLGAEFGMYSADVTRTIPSDGEFNAEQRVIYQAVLDAQKAGIAAAKPGATLGQIERAARRVLADALVAAGVVKDSGAAHRLCPHGLCHWLGLDVHDECPYTGDDGRGEVRLAPGMVTTVEPGCYIPAGSPGIDARWHEIGVRIEDDVLITANGGVILSASAPREIAEIEALMAESSHFPEKVE